VDTAALAATSFMLAANSSPETNSLSPRIAMSRRTCHRIGETSLVFGTNQR
jgi:hypothetical protein